MAARVDGDNPAVIRYGLRCQPEEAVGHSVVHVVKHSEAQNHVVAAVLQAWGIDLTFPNSSIDTFASSGGHVLRVWVKAVVSPGQHLADLSSPTANIKDLLCGLGTDELPGDNLMSVR